MPEEITELTAHLQQQSKKSLPKWEELPDIDLYMDQVIALMNRYLDNRTKDKMITPSMVNNYVKMKVMPAPVKKKYTREHLMYLIVICVLKQVMPLSSVETVLKDGLEQTEAAVFYGRFRELYGDAFRTAAEETISLTAAGASRTDAMLSLAMKAQAEQNLAEDLLEF